MEASRVSLPSSVRPPFEVYVNGVRQQEGEDYVLRGASLVFPGGLQQEGKLGFWRWFLGAWGIGTYRRNDVIDVRYAGRDGRTLVAHALPLDAGCDAPQHGAASG